MATVLTALADGVPILLSSHALAELERVADYLILLSHGRLQVADEADRCAGQLHAALTVPAQPVQDTRLRRRAPATPSIRPAARPAAAG
jgi:ABC-2 type transport system ATP-binding protein